MLVIKLSRTGKKHQAFYRLIINERRSKLNGKCLEDLGWYNPLDKQYSFKKERINHWLKLGAQKSETVHNLLVRAKVINAAKIPSHKVKKVEVSK
jgi:small subunit ribosomal protein S16